MPRFGLGCAAACTTLSLALFLTAPVASAGGPFEPPDGFGNPNATDYTGYQVVGYVYGVRHSAALNLRSSIYCANTGGADVNRIAVQFYSDGAGPSRSPVAADDAGSLPVSDQDTLTSGQVTGTPAEFGLARVLALVSVRNGKPVIVCQANLETITSGAPLAALTFQPAGKKK